MREEEEEEEEEVAAATSAKRPKAPPQRPKMVAVWRVEMPKLRISALRVERMEGAAALAASRVEKV